MQKRYLLVLLAATLPVTLPACAEPEPEVVEVTRVVNVPQTVEVQKTVEVTREVTKIIEEVVEETVVVTRIERVVVTATPTATPTSSPTPSAAPAATSIPTADVALRLLAAMQGTRSDLEELGGVIDTAVRTGVISCRRTVDLHTAIVNAPVPDASGSDDVTQWANGRHREAIEVYSEGASGLAEQCSNVLEGQGKNQIPAQTWTRARKGINDALAILIPAIEKLE